MQFIFDKRTHQYKTSVSPIISICQIHLITRKCMMNNKEVSHITLHLVLKKMKISFTWFIILIVKARNESI